MPGNQHHSLSRPDPRSGAAGRLLAEQMLSRAAGAPLVDGNRVRLLRDARENYPAWLNAIGDARRSILFENYIIENDAVGQRFAAALAERARAGVSVRVVYDWFGGLGLGSARVMRPVAEAGGEVRVFNPLWIGSPFGWMSRDHRKTLTVDGRVGYVSGLCVSSRWEGDVKRRIAPWRDTGVEITGPAVADIERAFAQVWMTCGSPLPESALNAASGMPRTGNVPLRVMANQPNTAQSYRLDQLIAGLSTRTLWLTDAYYVGMATYVQALIAAARDGVDVRLLVPGASNLLAVSTLSRAGYRVLLQAGIRVFEWNGPMLHAKTAVADGRWARVGSTNLNIISWLGNYELDVAVEDAAFAQQMEAAYEEDLENATEVLLSPRNRIRPVAQPERVRGRLRGSASRAASGAVLIGNTVRAAMTSQRMLGPVESGIMAVAGLAMLALAVVGVLWPLVVVIPLAAICSWIALTMLVRAVLLRNKPAENSTQSDGQDRLQDDERDQRR